MPFEDDYIKVKHPLSLNKWAEETSTYVNQGDLSELKNYIPERGCINTRKGILGLTHTPQTTDSLPWGPSTPSEPYPPGVDTATEDFAVIQAVLDFNGPTVEDLKKNALSGLDIYMSAGQSLSESGAFTMFYGNKKEGVSSVIMTQNTAQNTAAGNPGRNYGMRSANAFESWMPGHSSGVTAFLITYWIYPLVANPSAQSEWHLCFGNAQAGTGKMPWYMRHFDQQPQFSIADQNSGIHNWTMVDGVMKQDQWQFMAGWHDFTTGFGGFYHWDDVLGVETITLSETPPNANYFYPSSSYNTINAHSSWNATLGQPMPDLSDAFHGMIDYMTMWSKPFHQNNSSNITLVRYIRNMSWIT